MVYDAHKTLSRRIVTCKVLRDKVFRIATYPKYDRHQQELAPMASTFINKTSRNSNIHTGTNIISEYQELANEIHRTITSQNFKNAKYIHV